MQLFSSVQLKIYYSNIVQLGLVVYYRVLQAYLIVNYTNYTQKYVLPKATELWDRWIVAHIREKLCLLFPMSPILNHPSDSILMIL